jgi:hypothetical protein
MPTSAVGTYPALRRSVMLVPRRDLVLNLIAAGILHRSL